MQLRRAAATIRVIPRGILTVRVRRPFWELVLDLEPPALPVVLPRVRVFLRGNRSFPNNPRPAAFFTLVSGRFFPLKAACLATPGRCFELSRGIFLAGLSVFPVWVCATCFLAPADCRGFLGRLGRRNIPTIVHFFASLPLRRTAVR